MPFTVLNGFGSFPQSLISAVTNTVLVRLISSETGLRSSITHISAAPLPGENLAAGGLWLYPYFVIRSKLRYDQVQAQAQAGILPFFNAGLYDVGDISRLGNAYELLWYRRPAWGQQEFSWDFKPGALSCENESTLIVCVPLASQFNQATSAYAQEATGHFEMLTVLGETEPVSRGIVGRSLPRHDL